MKLKNTNIAIGLLHYRFRFGLIKNTKILFCRILGHRINNIPSNHWCGRCGLAYEKIYSNIGEGYYIESGIIKKT